MKTMLWYLIVWLALSLNRLVFAFPDSYEPDDTQEQATVIVVSDQKSPQHTLHSQTDEDWFKFYVHANPNVRYKMVVEPVGADIRVQFELYDAKGQLLETVNDGYHGERQSLPDWIVQADGIYYVKISDIAESSDHCRLNIQYQLQVSPTDAPIPASVQGVVKDAITGSTLKNAIVYTNCHRHHTAMSSGKGDYSLIHYCPMGLYELTAEALGYQPVTCQIPIPELATVPRDIALWPAGDSPPILSPSQLAFRNGDTLQPSQSVYRNGEQLKVAWQLSRLPPTLCARYYVGMAYPDGRLFIIRDLVEDFNQLEPFNPAVLPHWTGIGNLIIEQPVGSQLPRGEYVLYLLRMPASIKEPINQIEFGELNMTTFRIE